MTRRRTNTQPSVLSRRLSQIAGFERRALAVGVRAFMPCISDLLRQSLVFVSALRLSARHTPRVRPGPVPAFRCGCHQRPMHHHRGRFVIGSKRMGRVGTGTTQPNDIKGSTSRNNSIRCRCLRPRPRHLASRLLDGSSCQTLNNVTLEENPDEYQWRDRRRRKRRHRPPVDALRTGLTGNHDGKRFRICTREQGCEKVLVPTQDD